MLENNFISKKKRKSLHIEIPNKELTFCDTKRICIYKKNDINKTNYMKGDNLKNNSEDDYDSSIYNELISKENIIFGNTNKEKKNSLIKSNSELFNNNKHLIDKKNYILNNFDKNIKIKSKLNLSFENNNQNFVIDNEKSLIEEKSENYKNLNKLIKLFSFINKRRPNMIQNTLEEENNNIQNSLLNNDKIYIYHNSSKFSKKSKKNVTITEGINNSLPFGNRNITELYIDLEKGIQKNKITKINNISKKENEKNINKINPKKINFKMYDGYNISSDFNDTFEKERKIILKANNLNRSMRKININLNDSSIEKYIYLNKSKIKNHSINYSNPKKLRSEKRIKTLINDYMNRDMNSNYNMIYKSKNQNNIGKHKIIKKRVILEEEYIVNSEGDKKLLSVRRLDDENNNSKNKSFFIKNNFIREKTINNENPMNKKFKLNNSFFSSIFKDKSRKTVSNNKLGIKSIDVDNQMSLIFNNQKFPKTNFKKSKDIITNPSLIKTQNNRSNSKIVKNGINKLPIRTIVKGKSAKRQKLNKVSNINKEQKINKKLFYNRIYINKFNKSNNNSKINFHPNYINSNRTSINYMDDKEKSKIDNNKGIYNKISFSKKEPFMIYHNEEKNQNFYINNNQNCSNMVNIVFLNNEKNKGYKEIERAKPICGLKRNYYKCNEIKTISIDNNTSGIKSTRNLHNKNIINVSSYDDPVGIRKNNYSIYSSMDNAKDNRIKNPIFEYISSKPKLGINDMKKHYIKKSGFNKSGFSNYFIDYME